MSRACDDYACGVQAVAPLKAKLDPKVIKLVTAANAISEPFCALGRPAPTTPPRRRLGEGLLMAALSNSAPAVQNISTAGVAGYVGGYLINLYNVGMLVAGTYAHRFVDVVQPDALVMSQDIKMGVAAAIGGYCYTGCSSRTPRTGCRPPSERG